MENNNLKICNFCGVANEPDYNFCKSCGAPLNQNIAPVGSAPVFNDQINGVPTAEVHDYIGKNSDKFIPKFLRFCVGGKALWNWPSFILGLFGMNFVWFFYRKMYKIGAWLLAATLLITTVSSYTISTFLKEFEPLMTNYITESLEIDKAELSESEFFAAYDKLDARFEKDIEFFLETLMTSSKIKVLSALSQLASWASTALLIIIPIFADHLYYKKVFRDINKMNLEGQGNPYAVASTGGTNTALAVFVGIISQVTILIITISPIVSFLMNTIAALL